MSNWSEEKAARAHEAVAELLLAGSRPFTLEFGSLLADALAEIERLRAGVSLFVAECRKDGDYGGSPDFYGLLSHTIDTLSALLEPKP